MDMMAVVCMETFSCIALLTRARFSWLTGFQKIFEGSRNFFVTRFSGVAGAALAVTVIPWPDSLGQRSGCKAGLQGGVGDRKSTRLNSSHLVISYAVFCLKKNNNRTASCKVR